MFIRACLCLLLLLLHSVASASPAVQLTNEDNIQTLAPYMQFLVDDSTELNFESVKSAEEENWQPVSGDNIIGGFTNSAYWVKFSVDNRAKKDNQWILEVDYPIIDHIEFYSPTANGSYEKTIVGDSYPFEQRPIEYRNFAFPITTPGETEQQFFMRFKTESSMFISLNMMTGNAFTESVDGKLVLYGFIYGIVLLATIYSLINAMFLRERMYLFIAIAIFGSLGYSTSINGFAFQYFWPNALWLQSVAIPFFLNLCFGFALFYSREFLEMKKLSPLFDKVIIALSSFCLLVGVASLFLSYSAVIGISTVFAIVMSFAAFVAGAISLFKGNKAARYFLLGWMALFIGAVTFALKSLGILPSSLFSIWGQEFGFAGIAIFLTLAQSDRFFQAQKKHEAEQTFAMTAMKTAEKKYRSLFENAIEGIFQMDLSGRLVSANKAYAEILGSEDVNFLLAQSHPPFSINCLSEDERAVFRALTENEDAVKSYEAPIQLPNGTTRWVSISLQKIKDKNGKPLHFEGAMADITDTKKREKAEKHQRMAEAATEAKSLFLANMSHEIRTPMNAILGFTDLAMDKNKDEQIADFLHKIHSASSNLLGIINDILDFSKIEAGKLEIENTPFSLKEVLENLADIVSANVESKGLSFNLVVDEDIPDQLVGDPLRIGQVLLNLTNNAIKFTSSGSVTVELELISLSKRDMSLQMSGRVIDTGIGIPSDKLETLFSSFTQADDSTTRRFGGTGLGLSISKQLIEMMDGQIFVQSEEGKGSTFGFTIACKLQDRRKRSNPHFSDHQLPLNVLVVDDQEESRQFISKAFISLAHKVTCVTNAADAIQELKNKQDENTPYDVLVADWLMPDVDGISCCQQVKDDDSIVNPRMILVTGYDQDEAKAKAAEIGLDAYMRKPLKVPELDQVLQRIFKDRRTTKTAEVEASEFNFEGLDVLLVEDVVMNQELATEILSKKKINISIANNGKEGLEMLQERTFDILLMDMQMPVMDGCQATEAIREFNQQVPIVAMTANALTGDRDRCLASGMNDYITKPIDADEMFKAIAKWVTASRKLGEDEGLATSYKSETSIDDKEAIDNNLAQQSSSQLNDASKAFLASLDAAIEEQNPSAAETSPVLEQTDNALEQSNDVLEQTSEALEQTSKIQESIPLDKVPEPTPAPAQPEPELAQKTKRPEPTTASASLENYLMDMVEPSSSQSEPEEPAQDEFDAALHSTETVDLHEAIELDALLLDQDQVLDEIDEAVVQEITEENVEDLSADTIDAEETDADTVGADKTDAEETSAEGTSAEQEGIQDNTPELPDSLPGIKLKEGLKRCQDNETLYRRFLSDFQRDYSGSAYEFRTHAANEDFPSIKSLAHAIKGLTSNLAASPLSRAAANLETIEHKSEIEMNQALDLFEQELELMMNSIDKLQSSEAIPAPSPKPNSRTEPSESLSESELKEKIDTLAPMISAQKFDAHEVALALLEQWPTEDHKSEVNEVVEALDIFDFDGAETKLAELRETLQK